MSCCKYCSALPRVWKSSGRELGPGATYEFPVRGSDAIHLQLHLEPILICFTPAMSLGGPSSSQLDPKDEIGTTRKHHEDRDPGFVDTAAGPSNVSAAAATKRKRKKIAKGSESATPVPPGEQKSPLAAEEPSFENNGDFIAFGPVEDQHAKEDKENMQERDRDKGKGKASERDGGGGKKRKADFDRNDGCNNKKERTDAASRKAPWVQDVDWEGSANVAELYAFFSLGRGELVE